MIFLAFAFKVMILYICGAKCILQMHFKVMISLAFCLQSNGFAHMLCPTHFKVMIFLAFAFKVMILYTFGVKCILK